VTAEVVRAKRFELVDDEGKVRIILDVGSGDEKAVMGIQDNAGNNRAAFGIFEGGSVILALKDAGGTTRASLAIGEKSADQPRLIFADSFGRARAEIAVNDNGDVELALADKWGQKRAMLGVAEDVALGLYDVEGNLANGMVGRPPIALEKASE
jgi:hypothetical protein